MPHVRVGDLRMFVEEAGSGPPIVFISGLGSDHRAWTPVLPALAPVFRCITFDNRDVGATDRTPVDYTVKSMADDTLGLLDALGIGRFHAVGASMGGAIAQELALRCPDRVNRMVLIATYTSSDARGAAILESWLHLRRLLPPEMATRAILPWLYTVEDYAVPGLIEEALRYALEAPLPQEPDAYERQMRAALGHHIVGRLDSIRAPTLVLFGEDDILTPLRFARSLTAEVPDVRLRTLPHAGHSVVRTRSAEIAAAIRQFLDGAASA